ncbi:uncharacterized protein G2W53_041824 [Senna tora]|uniref:Uncharacterized protein n=1 Tax=Senna tora TaxID=362788 RepID=A0A834VYD6_9FABA|nr:uncharacterized protein G2W53_041824 [Senna tora]
MEPPSNDGQDALMANIGKGKNIVADHVVSSESQGIHPSKKGQASTNDKHRQEGQASTNDEVASHQLVISSTLLDSIVKNQQALNEVVEVLTKNPKKNHDPSMEREDPRRALDGMFLDAPTCCRQRIPPRQMENFIANIKREIAKDRHSSTNKAKVCDQGKPDKAHGHPEAGRLQEKGSASRAKTRSFPLASWLTLMISACEAKTKSYVYEQRVRRSWQRQGASGVLRVIHRKDLHVVHQVGAKIQSMEEMTIAFCHARSRHQLIKQAQRTVASMRKVNKAKKVRKDRVLRPYSNRRRATTLNLQLVKCKKPTQQDSM